LDSKWNKKWNIIMIKYKIIETNAAQHSIVVRFYTDVITEEMLATDTLDGIIRRCRTDYSFDLPIPAPDGLALHEFISAKAPVAWFNAQEAILNPLIDTSLSAITSLVGVEAQVAIQTDPVAQSFIINTISV
jgi:hypothetical protein